MQTVPWPAIGRAPIRLGEKIGTLTVIGREGEGTPYTMIVRCDCGLESRKGSHNLRREKCNGCSSPKAAAFRVGKRFGALTVLGRKEPWVSKRPRYQVRCDCGREYDCSISSLVKAKGCKTCRPGGNRPRYGAEAISMKNLLYRTWTSMRHRCRAVDDPKCRYHGGKGITVCAEWHAYVNFRAWAFAHGYKPGLSIDRVNSDGNYEPGNCEWVTRAINSKRARAGYILVRKTKDAFAPSRYLPIEMLFGGA